MSAEERLRQRAAVEVLAAGELEQRGDAKSVQGRAAAVLKLLARKCAVFTRHGIPLRPRAVLGRGQSPMSHVSVRNLAPDPIHSKVEHA